MNIVLKDRLLIVNFSQPQLALSWAIYGGGKRQTKSVVWVQVKTNELEQHDAKQFLREKLVADSLTDAVGMLTSADLSNYIEKKKEYETLSAHCIATVGMSNALRVGDKSHETICVGTINLLCAVSQPLSYEAHLEALSIAVEARTAAVLDAEISSTQSGELATGTGTDCAVVICPDSEQDIKIYAGKHTVLGSLIGETVYEAVNNGLRLWKVKSPQKDLI